MSDQKSISDQLVEKKEAAKTVSEANENLVVENNIPVDPEALSYGEKMLAAIGYFSFLCILPLILKPDSKFCQLHGKQALILTVSFLVFGWVSRLFGFFWLGFPVMVSFIYVGIAAFGMVLATQGKAQKLPIVGQMADKLEW